MRTATRTSTDVRQARRRLRPNTHQDRPRAPARQAVEHRMGKHHMDKHRMDKPRTTRNPIDRRRPIHGHPSRPTAVRRSACDKTTDRRDLGRRPVCSRRGKDPVKPHWLRHRPLRVCGTTPICPCPEDRVRLRPMVPLLLRVPLRLRGPGRLPGPQRLSVRQCLIVPPRLRGRCRTTFPQHPLVGPRLLVRP